MGKPKKGRNVKTADAINSDEGEAVLIEQTNEANEETGSGNKAKSGKKKGKKDKKNTEWDVDEIVNQIEGLDVNSSNKDKPEVGDEPVSKSKKDKKKKGKKKDWGEDELMEDVAAIEAESDSNVTEEQASKSKKDKKKKGKKKDWGEDELMEDVAAIEAESDSNVTEEQAPKSKKDKKKKGKKKDWGEDELLEDVAAIEAENDSNVTEEHAPKSKKDKKKKGKKDLDEDELMEDGEVNEGNAESNVTEEDAPKSKKKSDKKPDDTGEEAGTMKTAAQKKADKKERDKKKKEKQRLEAKSHKLKQEAKMKQPEGTAEDATGAEEKAAKILEDEAEKKEDAGEDVEEEEGEKKKKKKKKGEVEEKDTKKKGKIGKGKLKAMQEALQKMKEEEERLLAEEAARQKAQEEAEERRLEKLQKEKEKKERERQKKKDRIDRMKKEGTYMTKAQREAKARAELMLEAMKQQGIEVPTKDAAASEAGPKRVRYGTRTRRKDKKDHPQDVSANDNEEVPKDGETTPREGSQETVEREEEKVEKMEEEKKEEEEKKVEKEVKNVEKEVKDSWEVESEEEDVKEEEPISKTEITVKPKKDLTEDAEEDDDAEEEEGEDDEEEESSEEDSEESDSEEESSSSEEEHMTTAEKIRETAVRRIQKRREDAEANISTDHLRCPVVCVLGHVDTGKTKILDMIRHTNVQDGEAGGITQQIGATKVPEETIKEQTKMCRQFAKEKLRLPGLLIIDTPGHESFSNLRSRGSSLCDIAIVVVDIMHGLEPQTIESLDLLRSRKTPFIVALNKVDRLFEWKVSAHTDIVNTIKKQKRHTKDEFDERTKGIITEFAEQGINAALFYENPDPKTYVSMVPTSAHSADGMGNLIALLVELSQTMLAKRLAFSDNLQCTTLEVKALPGLGTTIDVVLVNGTLKEGDTMVLAGQEGPIVTSVRGLLMPQPLKELRVKNQYEKFKVLQGAQGIKVLAKDLDKALAGMPLLVAQHPDEVEILKEEVAKILKDALKSIKLTDRGVFVQSSTLGSLEALLEFLKTSKIPYAGINIGPVHKRDVMKASVMLEHDTQYAVILAFDVRIEREAQEMADREGIKIFHADIIYHLLDNFMAHREQLRLKKREEFKHVAVFPCKLRVMPSCVFNARNPIVVGVNVEAGIVKEGTPICVPSKENLNIGVISSLELNHKQVPTARKGQEVCIKIENVGGDAPKMYGRHFDHEDILVSKITRESIDAVKNYFREDLEKADWQVMIELKKILEIL